MNRSTKISLAAAMLIGGFVALAAGFGAAGRLAGAAEAPAPPKRAGFDEFWSKLTPEEQAALKDRKQRFMQLPPAERERMMKRWQHFKSLSTEERQALRERWQMFRSLPPESRTQMRQMHQHWENMPPERRQAIIEKMQDTFRQMPDHQLADFFHKLNVWRMLSPQDREQASSRFAEIRKQRHQAEDMQRPPHGEPQPNDTPNPDGAAPQPAEPGN